MVNIRDLNYEELEETLVRMGEKKYRAKQIFSWLYKGIDSFDEMTDISKELIEKLKQNFVLKQLTLLDFQKSKDGTIKYLFELNDGHAIESVLMQYKYGYTACISNQIGCKMGCNFCASAKIGFVRNMTPGEIAGQILAVQKESGVTISNVVFMGIGEPLDNYDNVIKAIRLINDPKGLNIGARHISISTSGIVPKIYELADRAYQFTLSISLHATNDKKRSEMMPVNNAYNIEELMKACRYYIGKTNKRISFEYALAKDNNDKYFKEHIMCDSFKAKCYYYKKLMWIFALVCALSCSAFISVII